MKTTRVFAIDFGASGGKCFAGAFGPDGFTMQEVHRFAHENIAFFIPDRSGTLTERAFWDDTYLYSNIIQGLHAYRRTVSDSLDSIGIDTWGSDGQFVTADGDMLGKVYAYRDHRLDNMIDVVKARINTRKMYKLTGIHFQPFNITNQLHWFMLNRKELLRKQCTFLPIPTLFYFYLGGVKKVDSSWASVTQVMNAQTRDWDPYILRKLKIPADVMPEIVEPGAIVGQLHAPIAQAVGLNRAQLIAVGSHDTASAYAAAPIDDPDTALIISSGTWSLVGRLVPEPITTPKAMSFNFSNEGGIGNVRLLKNCMGSWLTQELRRVWRIADGREMSWKELDQLTFAARPFVAMINPDDKSFYNPANMETAIADYCSRTGQPVPPGRGEFIRTVYESLAFKYRMANEELATITGRPSKVVHIVGGGSKNSMLNQFTADCTGLPVIAGPEEATAVGNIMVQALGLGLIKQMRDALPIIRQAFPIKDYKPQASADWNRQYVRFTAMIAAAAG